MPTHWLVAPLRHDLLDVKAHLKQLPGSEVDLVPREGLKPRLRPIVAREEIRVA